MSRWNTAARVAAVAATILFAAGCQDTGVPMGPADQADAARAPQPGQEIAALFRQVSPEVMGLPQTVFAAHDEQSNRLVFGVENANAAAGVRTALSRRGVSTAAYEVVVTEPIHFMNTTLRTEHRPTVGGLQIHWDGFVCTLGFNVSHGAGRSFITNSHCTTVQGQDSNTFYHQPVRASGSGSHDAIADEVDDPAYDPSLPGCSSGKRCRYSDASRALYRSEAASSQGVIAKTTGVNNGSLTVAGSFTVTEQNNTGTSFIGTIHKVGRTTGWTSGNVTNTCATVNVSSSDIQLLCQTLVQRKRTKIVQGGDSGSPVFRITSGDDVELVGILWGGSMNGDLFVFSPLSGIQGELGAVTATFGNGGTTPPPAPSDPSNLTATAVSSSQINLSWSDNSGNEEGFKIERCQGSGCSSFSQIATVGANATSFQNTGLSASTEYSYRVRAYNAGGDSGYSNTASATTGAASGQGVVLTVQGSKVQGRMRAELSWSPVVSATIDIWRQAGTGAAWVRIQTGINNTGAFVDQTSFVGGGRLSYQVCEPGTAQGSSACSNVASWTF